MTDQHLITLNTSLSKIISIATMQLNSNMRCLITGEEVNIQLTAKNINKIYRHLEETKLLYHTPTSLEVKATSIDMNSILSQARDMA